MLATKGLFTKTTFEVPTLGTGVGGEDQTVGGLKYYVAKFTTTSNLVSSTVTFVVNTDMIVDYLLIGGGGSGGAGSGGGGGGAGMFLTGTNLVLDADTYTMQVGGGGDHSTNPSGGSYNGYGAPGGITKITNSSGTVIAAAIGGGTGGNETSNHYTRDGREGGSGGGGFGRQPNNNDFSGIGGLARTESGAYNGFGGGSVTAYGAQTGVIPTGGTAFGNDGAKGDFTYYGGGGGGAGTEGVGEEASTGGDGKNEVMGLSAADTTTMLALTQISLGVVSSGTRYLAGGGGGHRQASGLSAGGVGGKGGGGNGGCYASSEVAGGANGTSHTGSGGGGSWHGGNGPGVGGSGVILLRFHRHIFE